MSGKGVFRCCIGLGVTDEAVDPQVRDSYLDCVAARLQRTRDIDAVRSLPHRAKRATIHRDLRDIRDIAKIKPELLSLMKP